MAFTPINSSTILPGQPIKSELFTTIKANFDDHESRISALSVGSTVISLINDDVKIASTSIGYLTGALHIEVVQSCIITEIAIQLFEKSPAISGNLTIDIKKNNSTNPSGFVSVLSILPTFNISTASDYQRTTGTINTSNQNISNGDILRLDITSLPVGLQSFRVVVKAVV